MKHVQKLYLHNSRMLFVSDYNFHNLCTFRYLAIRDPQTPISPRGAVYVMRLERWHVPQHLVPIPDRRQNHASGPTSMHFLERMSRTLIRDIQGPYWDGPHTRRADVPAAVSPFTTSRMLSTTNVGSTSQILPSQVEASHPTNQRHSRSHPSIAFPPELLETIFTFLTLRDTVYSYGSSPEIAVRAVSQVCRHWRQVALACPRLWGAIIDYNKHHPRWIRELQSRSRNTPLDIRATLFPSKPDTMQALIRVLEKMHTCRSLCLGIPTVPPLQSILPSIQSPAQALEVFRLYMTHSEGERLPETLFGGCAPRLREIVVRGSAIDLRAPILQNLTCLRVSNVPLRLRSPVSEWLSTLGRVPHLEILDLRQAFSPSAGSCSPIHLTKLFDLNIEDSLTPCGIFLAHLHSPNVIHLTIKCGALFNSDLNHPSIATGFRQHLQNWADSPSCNSMLLELSSKTLRLNSSARWQSTVSPSLLIQWTGHSANVVHQAFATVLAGVPFSKLASLRLTASPESGGSVILILPHFASLPTLCIQTEETANIVLPLLGVALFGAPPVFNLDVVGLLLPSLRIVCFGYKDTIIRLQTLERTVHSSH